MGIGGGSGTQREEKFELKFRFRRVAQTEMGAFVVQDLLVRGEGEGPMYWYDAIWRGFWALC